jgi:hypothetical protein
LTIKRAITLSAGMIHKDAQNQPIELPLSKCFLYGQKEEVFSRGLNSVRLFVGDWFAILQATNGSGGNI